jgi:hypothetical protein
MSVDVDVLAELAFRAIRWGETSGSVEGPYPLGLAQRWKMPSIGPVVAEKAAHNEANLQLSTPWGEG